MWASPYHKQHIQIGVYYKVFIPNYTPIFSLDVLPDGVSFFWYWGLGLVWVFSSVFLFLELLSLLVIHLCKHCRYQPQYSLWLTLLEGCSLQHTSTSNCNDLLQLLLYDGEKNSQSCSKIRKIGHVWDLKTDLFDSKLSFLINWLHEGSTGLPKKDVIMDTFFLMNGNTIGRYSNSRGK